MNNFLLQGMKNVDIHSSTVKVGATFNLMRKYAEVAYFTGIYAMYTFCFSKMVNTLVSRWFK